MADFKDIAAEIAYRTQADAGYFGGTLPERNAIGWRSYLAALLEWDLISISQYDSLRERIPPVEDDPAIAILRGRD